MTFSDRLLTPAFVLALMLTPGALPAESLSGNELHTACSASDNLIMQTACSFYSLSALESMKWGAAVVVIAISDGSIPTSEVDQTTNLLLGFCVPEDVSNEQIGDLVTKYLDDNPETRHHPARGLIHNALKDAYPCEILGEGQ